MTHPAREDLLALTQDGLIQLANGGLVKRGLREMEAGQGPAIDVTEDGTVEARFADGTLTRLARARSPADATCTCPASGMCRHRVLLVLAYQQGAPKPAGEAAAGASWNPADFEPAGVDAVLPQGARNELARLLRQPLEIRLEFGQVPSARLPMATVRFLVPHDLAYARCDCALGQNCAHIALAVHAFKAGRAQGSSNVTLDPAPRSVSPAIDAAIAATDAVLERLLAEGVVAGQAAHAQTMALALRTAAAAKATWLELTLEALDRQIHAYGDRSALHDEHAALRAAVELFARTHATEQAGAQPSSYALGIGESMETAMAQTRLVSLGARICGNSRELEASVLLADTDTGATFLIEKNFRAKDAEHPLALADVLSRNIAAGVQVGALARGQLLTAVAKRRADGSLSLGLGRGGKTVVMPHDGKSVLPVPLSVTRLSGLAASHAERPPAFLRPRNRSNDVHAFAVARVVGQAFDAGAQRWHAAVELAEEGGTLHLERMHDAGAPHALEVLFAAADGRFGPVRQVAGPVRFESGACICTPWSITADTLIVPDTDSVPERVDPPLTAGRAHQPDLLARGAGLLAELVHQGRRHLPRDYPARCQALAGQLQDAGYLTAAACMTRFAAALQGGSLDAACFGELAAWLLVLMEE